VEETLKALHGVGVLHVEQSSGLKPVDKAAIDDQRKEIGELSAFIDDVLGYVTEKREATPQDDIEVVYTRPFAEIRKEVKALHDRFGELHDKAAKVDVEIEALAEQTKYLTALTQRRDVSLKDLDFTGDYLFSRVFVLLAEGYENIRQETEKSLFESAAGTVDDETILHAIGKRKKLETIESLINGAGGRRLLVPDKDLTVNRFLDSGQGELDKLKERSARLHKELQGRVEEELSRIALLHGALEAEGQRLAVLAKAAEAKYVNLVEGWAPEDSVEAAIFELKKSIGYVFVDSREPGLSEEPPTKQRNPTPLKPFQLIVRLFGTPNYREWDPTPIIAYSFAIFFGLMIADVGYAIGLIVLARFLLPRFVGGASSEGVKQFQKLIYISAAVALTLGLLAGNYLGDVYLFLGFENLALVSVVQQTLQSPITFVIMALLIGFIHVNIAHLIALIKGVKKRDAGLILNKVGLLLLQLGIPFILRLMLRITLPLPAQIYDISIYAMLAGVVLLVIGTIKQWGGLGAILWLFDLTGLLGDIMSYSRLAGVGLATFYLGSAFNMLARLFSDIIPVSGMAGVVLGTVIAVVILFIGHTINLLLGLITGFVHSLRLCFVEFLIKFYEGRGRDYTPFRLIKRQSILVGTKS